MSWSRLHTFVVSALLLLITFDYLLIQLSYSGGPRLEDAVTILRTGVQSWPAAELPTQSVRIDALGVTPLMTETFFLFGPYVPVIAGTYELRVDGVAHKAGTLIRGELAGQKGSTVYHAFAITSDQLPFRAVVQLPNVSELEVRFRAEQAEGSTLSRLTLTRTDINWRGASVQAIRSAVGLRQSFFRLQFY